MTDDEMVFISKARVAATQAGHVFPSMAAAEAALESGYGKSGLAQLDNNLFGMKQHTHPEYGTVTLPTREFEGGQWVATTAEWVKYPDWMTCFADRMATLGRLSIFKNSQGQLEYPHYAAALAATDPITYISEVSATWSTDPERAAKVVAIYNEAGFNADTDTDGEITV